MSPEIIVFNTVSSVVNYIRKDIELNAATKENSLLFKILGNGKLGRNELYKEAVELFRRPVGEGNRGIETRLFFDASRAGLPTVHITLPTDNKAPQGNGIGLDKGFAEPAFREVAGVMYYSEPITRTYSSECNIIVTSGNSMETVIIYKVLKSILTSVVSHFSIEGLELAEVTRGGDIILNDEHIPVNFARAITISFIYDDESTDIITENIAANILNFNSIPHEYRTE